jgi:hypothetical protein
MPIEISAVVRIGIAGWGNIFILSYYLIKILSIVIAMI